MANGSFNIQSQQVGASPWNLLNLLFGQANQAYRIPTQTETGQQSLEALLQQGLQGLSGQGELSPISQQAQKRFQQQTIPSIAERFSGLGGQSSSAFRQAIGGAGADLQGQLAALDQQNALRQIALGLTPQFETGYMKGGGGLLGGLLSNPGFGEALGKGAIGGLASLFS